MCARDGDLLALAPVLFVFAFVTLYAFSQSQSSAGRPVRLYGHTEIIARRAGPRAGSARTMAAQPPRQPPNNLLFCGPPPELPHVVLLPSDNSDRCNFVNTSDASLRQTNDANALNEINNVGVPIYENFYENQVEQDTYHNDVIISDSQIPPETYMRRAHSFDISDIMTPSPDTFSVLRHGRSEPDLSKYGLFVEAEVTVEPVGPLQPPPLVLNNPFYDASYALDPAQLNSAMVVLPENYLAFEDSFVPSFDYKPELLVENFNPDLYYDGYPMIPQNDPWSAYGIDNSAFQYYPSHFDVPIVDHDAIQYMPLTDLDYAIPQYLNLPVIEQSKNETTVDNNNSSSQETSKPNLNESSDTSETCTTITPENLNFTEAVVVSNAINEEEKLLDPDLTNREASIQSEESLNADTSIDVTSSLAFIPSSKYSPQRPQGIGADDTSNDTSPCSTDYHEASALDIIQSLDELSCCDSDYSQSRDDTSPVTPEIAKVNATTVSCETVKDKSEISGSRLTPETTSLGSLPLSKLPSIPLHNTLPTKLPLVLHQPHNQNPSLEQSEPVVVKATETLPDTKPSSSKCSNQSSEQYIPTEVKIQQNTNPSRQPPQPPAVPPSWLAPKKSFNDNNTHNTTQSTPQIYIQNAEDQPIADVKSPKPSPKASASPNHQNHQKAEEPQPSCSYAPPRQPAPATQLKPDKQPKEDEVSSQ